MCGGSVQGMRGIHKNKLLCPRALLGALSLCTVRCVHDGLFVSFVTGAT